ncbi:hypothetical protein BVX97_01375 [bacterium E08(2017)]|nr:hypothetical protein BVX97_01375 [bacterium E08(2017)]
MARILLIDDDELGAKTTARVLEQYGQHQVIIASDGPTGLVTASKENPDLILLDILMPGMDGYAVLEELKSNEASLNIPVIIISAVTDEESIKEATFKYDTLYMTKPIEPEPLMKTIDHALSTRE